ncbi:hypothetical protein [Marinimicrobium sp. ARAG 43.8]|uniref:hypothetical protein n=1 Tax=Marinimicrobium sp. ARAG 43.8 TaxID=3418719 RepID=UPI003CEFD30A
MRFLSTVLIFSLAALSGCATNQGPSQVRSANPDLPPIAVSYASLSDTAREDCLVYKGQSIVHHCKENDFSINALVSVLRNSGRFEHVLSGGFNTEFQVLISSSRKTVDDAKGFANAIASGASLMLIPMQQAMILNSEFTILWRGEVIEQHSEEFPATQSISWRNAGEHYHDFVGQALAEKLMDHIDQHNPFTAEHIAEVMESTDYGQLHFPETLKGFRETDRFQYHDPLMGTIVSYIHEQFAFDHIDVFVYPIRSIDWTDQEKAVTAEMENIRSEILFLEKEGHIQDVTLSAAQITPTQSGTVIGFMDGHYFTDQTGKAYTASYAFIKEDKFVKVRASFPLNDDNPTINAPDDFVHSLMTSISVPGESLYMARARKAHRERAMIDE